MGHLGSLVTPLVDGQLSPGRAESAHAHLINCRSCQHAVVAERAARAAAGSAPIAPAGPELSKRLMAISEQEHPDQVRASGHSQRAGGSPFESHIGAPTVARPVRNRVAVATFASLSLVVISLFIIGGQQRDVQEPSDILATGHPVQDSAPLDPVHSPSEVNSQRLLEWMAAGGWVSPRQLPDAMVANAAHVLSGASADRRILRVDLDHDGDQVTVLEQQAHLDESKLAALEPVQVGHHEVYLIEEHWWVLQCGEVVVAVSSGEDPSDAHELIAALPDRGPTEAAEPEGALERIVQGWKVLTGGS